MRRLNVYMLFVNRLVLVFISLTEKSIRALHFFLFNKRHNKPTLMESIKLN